MKVYVIIDTWIDAVPHCDYIDCFLSAEDALMFVQSNRQDGHKLEVIVKEFDNPCVPKDTPLYPYCPFTPTTPTNPYYNEFPVTVTCSVGQNKEVDND